MQTLGEPGEGNDNADRSSHHPSVLLPLVLVIVFLLYPLSVGPVAKICGNPPPPAVVAFYKPLAFLHTHSDLIRAFFDWYSAVWGVRL